MDDCEGANPAGKARKKTLTDEVAEALGAVDRVKPSPDELADRETGSPGLVEDAASGRKSKPGARR